MSINIPVLQDIKHLLSKSVQRKHSIYSCDTSDKGCLLNKSLQSANTLLHQGRSNVKCLVIIALHDSVQSLKKNVNYIVYIMLCFYDCFN